MAAQDRPHARGCESDAQSGELATDAPVAPGRILPGQSDDEGDRASGNRRPSWGAMEIGPTSTYEVAVPPKQGVGLDEEASTAPSGEQSRQSGEECSIGWLKCWPRDLAPKHGNFVPEDDHLDRQLIAVAP